MKTQRIASIGLFALLSILPAISKQSSAPTIVLNYANGATVHQSASPIGIQETVASSAGLKTVSLSGGFSALTAYPGGAKSCLVKSYFFCSYFPVGDYVFKASAVATDGQTVTKSITLHVVK